MQPHEGNSHKYGGFSELEKGLRAGEELYEDLRLAGTVALYSQPDKQQSFFNKLDLCVDAYLSMTHSCCEAIEEAKCQKQATALALQLVGNLALENKALVCCEWYRDYAADTWPPFQVRPEELLAMKALGAMNASFGAHLPAVLDLARQATTGGFPDMAKGPLVTLINTFITQHLPLFTDLVQQALCGDLEQLPTAAAYSLLFAEWAEGCMGHISLGGQGSDIIVNALIQVAGYPSEDVACLAVPFWQTFSHLSSQNIMQGYNNLQVQESHVHADVHTSTAQVVSSHTIQPQIGSGLAEDSVLQGPAMATESDCASSLAESQSKGTSSDDGASIESWGDMASDQGCDHFKENMCLAATAVIHVKPTQVPSYNLTAISRGAAGWAPSSTEQAVDGYIPNGYEVHPAGNGEVSPETLSAPLQPSPAAAMEDNSETTVTAVTSAKAPQAQAEHDSQEIIGRPQRTGRVKGWARKVLKGIGKCLFCCVLCGQS